jgi:hypothetical protein
MVALAASLTASIIIISYPLHWNICPGFHADIPPTLLNLKAFVHNRQSVIRLPSYVCMYMCGWRRRDSFGLGASSSLPSLAFEAVSEAHFQASRWPLRLLLQISISQLQLSLPQFLAFQLTNSKHIQQNDDHNH